MEKISSFLRNRRYTIGIAIFGCALIISSIVHIGKLINDVDVYVFYYADMPPWLIITRYSFSWLQRVVGIFIGVGLLSHKNIARKAGILLGCFAITTIYWKHPYDAFKIHAQYLDKIYSNIPASLGAPELSFSAFVLPSVIVHCLLDVLFWVVFIYFFNRPAIKSYLK